MFRSRCLLLVLMLLAPTCALAKAQTPVILPNKAGADNITLTAGVAKTVAEGQPVVLKLGLYNNSPNQITVALSTTDETSFLITIRDSAGRVVPKTVMGNRLWPPPGMGGFGWSGSEAVMVNSHQTRWYCYNLAALFDLSRPGEYTVSTIRWQPFYSFPQQGPLTAAPLQFHMSEDADAFSGPVAFTPAPTHGDFLYATEIGDENYQTTDFLSRFRVANDGSIWPTLDRATQPGTQANSLAATPDGRFLYVGNFKKNAVSQYSIADDGVIKPLSPPTVPSEKVPGDLLMDPHGRYLWALGCWTAIPNGTTPDGQIIWTDGTWGNTLYAVGPDGRLTVTNATSSTAWAKDKQHVIISSTQGVINPAGTILYASAGNGGIFGYRLARDGQVTALPPAATQWPEMHWSSPHYITLTPSGRFAFVLAEHGWPRTDQIISLRVAKDGSLTRLPGAVAPQVPALRSGEYPNLCISLTVDPTSGYLIAVYPRCLDCFRIEKNGSLTPLGVMQPVAEPYVNWLSVLCGARGHTVYAVDNDSLNTFRLDPLYGLVPAIIDTPGRLPYIDGLIAAHAPTPVHWGPTEGGLQISLRLPGGILPVDRPVIMTVTLKNISHHPIPLGGAGADMASFQLLLTGPPPLFRTKSKPPVTAVPLLNAGRRLLDSPQTGGRLLTLPPGKEREYRFVLSRLADMTMEGDYTIQISRSIPHQPVVISSIAHLRLDYPVGKWRSSNNTNELDVP